MKSFRATTFFWFVTCLLAINGCSKKETPEVPKVQPEELVQHTQEFKQELLKVTDGVYVAIGYGLANSILLEGTDGTVIIDTMESAEAALPVKKAFSTITSKPLKAIILTHNHADHTFGTGVFAGNRQIDIYSHEKTLAELDRVITLTQEVTYRRAMRMFGTFLPQGELLHCGIGPFLKVNDQTTIDYRRPNKTFSGKRMALNIAGLKLELLYAPGETDDQIVVWFPEKKILFAADDFYKSFPNLYTIRGTKYRDVRQWAATVEEMRKLGTDFLVPSHTRPISGQRQINEVLSDYRDAIQFVHDQTIRGINKGLSPDELAETIRLPPHLAEKPYLREYYGTVAWSVRNIYNGTLGWFNGNGTHLNPLPVKKKAENLVRLAGGHQALLKEAEKALKEGDHPWVLELSDYLLVLKPGLSRAKEMKATSLRALGLGSGNANARNTYLTQALETEGKVKLTSPKINPDTAHRVPLPAIFTAMGAKLNPEKSKDVQQTVGFRFPDTQEAFTIEVRRGVAFIEPVFPPNPDLTLTVHSRVWKEIVAKLTNPAVALAKGEVKIEGGVLNMVKFLNLFRD